MSYYRGLYSSRRRQNVRLLDSEIRTRTRRRIRHASIGIIGTEHTGKRTLAYRFGAMNQGPFEDEVESRYYYLAHIDLDDRLTNGTGDVYLKSYIIPPPSDLPEEDPPSYYNEVDNFSAMIFICSVTEKESFMTSINRLLEIREEEPLSYFLIVGNKMDVDRSIYPDHFTFTFGLLTTRAHFAANYEECSAKQNLNVDIILEQILVRIIAEQP